MKRMAALVFVLAVGLSTAAATDTDVLEELRRGEHFDRASLFGTGPDVLADALAGDKFNIANLGTYFENGDRGFPANEKLANRLYEAAYRHGHWLSAIDLAQAAEAAGDVRTALRYYVIYFLAAKEDFEIHLRTGELFLLSIPGPTHLAYAEIQILLRTGAIPQDDLPALEREATREAISRGFIGDCPGVATRQCVDIADDNELVGCQIKAEDRCYLERARR